MTPLFTFYGFNSASNTISHSFVGELTDRATTEGTDFMSTAITEYWTVILSVLFVGFMIGLFWWLARKLFGHKQL